jgi:biotin carboxyl carrier protein
MVQATVLGKQFLFPSEEEVSSIDIQWIDERNLHILYGFKTYNAVFVAWNQEEKILTVRINGNDYDVQLKNETDLLIEKLGMSGTSQLKVNHLKAPMPGLIVNVLAQAGKSLKKGEPLIILEAMKMENIIKAPADVVVKNVRVQPKQAVEKGEILIEFI